LILLIKVSLLHIVHIHAEIKSNHEILGLQTPKLYPDTQKIIVTFYIFGQSSKLFMKKGNSNEVKEPEHNHVRFKPILEEYEDRVSSSNDEGTDRVRPSSLRVGRKKPTAPDKTPVVEESKNVKPPPPPPPPRPDETKESSSRNQHSSLSSISAEDLALRTRLRTIFEGKGKAKEKGEADEQDTTSSSNQDEDHENDTRHSRETKPQKQVLTLKTGKHDLTTEEKDDGQDEKEAEEEEEENDQEKYHIFHLFEVAESIINGQMMKIKTGVAGNIPLQDSFPLFKSYKHYLMIYWSVLIPQDDWSLIFFDELIDESYFASNFSFPSPVSPGVAATTADIVDRPSLLKIAKKIIPLSEISEVFLDQKTTTSFRFYRGQEVTQCTPVSFSSSAPASLVEFTASAWADAIYSVLQLQSFTNDDVLLQRYYEEYFALVHPPTEPLLHTKEHQHREEEKREKDNEAANRKGGFNGEIFKTRQRALSGESNNSNSPSSSSYLYKLSATTNNDTSSGSRSPLIHSTSVSSIFAFRRGNTLIKRQSSTPDMKTATPPISPAPVANKRGSIIQAVKNLFVTSPKPGFKDDAPQKLFGALHDDEETEEDEKRGKPEKEKKEQQDDHGEEEETEQEGEEEQHHEKKRRPAGFLSPMIKNQQEKRNSKTHISKLPTSVSPLFSPTFSLPAESPVDKPVQPNKAARRWTMFTNANDNHTPKRSKGMESSVPHATLEREQQEGPNNLPMNGVPVLTKRKNSRRHANLSDSETSNERRERNRDRNSFHKGSSSNNDNSSEDREAEKAIIQSKKPFFQQPQPVSQEESSNAIKRTSFRGTNFELPSSHVPSATAASRTRSPSMEDLTKSVLFNSISNSSPTHEAAKRLSFGRGTSSFSSASVNTKQPKSPKRDMGASTNDLETEVKKVVDEEEESEEKEQEIKLEQESGEKDDDEAHEVVVNNPITDSVSRERIVSESVTFQPTHHESQFRRELKSPAEQLGKRTILDSLYEQSKSPHNRPILQLPMFSDDEDATARSTQQSKEEEHYHLQDYQKKHQELINIKVFSPSKGGKGKGRVDHYISENAFKEELIAANKGFKEYKITDPIFEKKQFQQQQLLHQQQKELLAKMMKKKQGNASSTVDPAVIDDGKAEPLSGKKAGQSKSPKEKALASPQGSKDERERKLLNFLRGNANALDFFKSTSSPLTKDSLKQLNHKNEETEEEEDDDDEDNEERNGNQIKQKSLSMITMADNLFNTFRRQNSGSSADELPPSANNSSLIRQSSFMDNFSFFHKEKVSPPSSHEAKKSTNSKNSDKSRSVSPRKKHLKKITSTGSVSSNQQQQQQQFQNYYSKGMVSDSDESYLGKNKRNPTTSSFKNDHSIIIEREKEKLRPLSKKELKESEKKNIQSEQVLNPETTEESKAGGSRRNSLRSSLSSKEEDPSSRLPSNNAEARKSQRQSILIASGNASDNLTSIPASENEKQESKLSTGESSNSKILPPPQSKKRTNPVSLTINDSTMESSSSTNLPTPLPAVPPPVSSVSPQRLRPGSKETSSAEVRDNKDPRTNISPVKERTSLKRIFGSMITKPFDDTPEQAGMVAEETKSNPSSAASSRGNIANNRPFSASIVPSAASSSSSKVHANLPSPVNIQFLRSPSPSSSTVIVPPFLSCYYYLAIADSSSSSSPSMFQKYEITLSLLTKFELQTKLITSNHLLTRRNGLQYRKTKQQPEMILTSNVIIAELLESSHYIQLSYRYNASSSTSHQHSPRSTSDLYEEYLFVPLEGKLLVSFIIFLCLIFFCNLFLRF
jgi:hypothetical protein